MKTNIEALGALGVPLCAALAWASPCHESQSQSIVRVKFTCHHDIFTCRDGDCDNLVDCRRNRTVTPILAPFRPGLHPHLSFLKKPVLLYSDFFFFRLTVFAPRDHFSSPLKQDSSAFQHHLPEILLLPGAYQIIR